MRLYLKLTVILLVAAAVQSLAPSGPGHNELWFAIRCHIACLTHDRALQARLVDEQYQILRQQQEEPVAYVNATAPAAPE